MPARRLLAVSRGGGHLTPAPSFTASGPYDPGLTVGATVLTQVHCHTTQSDGNKTPTQVVAQYQAAGYGALAITDHDVVTSQPPGITTKIVGNELSPTTCHIIGLNTSYTRGGTTDPQGIIDGITGAGGIAEVAHPKWLRGQSYAQMAALTDYVGFEIHNVACVPGALQNPVTYPGFAIDRWDQLLSAVRRDLWGFSVDDYHAEGAFTTYDTGRLKVFVASNSLANIMAAITSGNFVADVSNYGVTPGVPARTDDDVSLTCTGATAIEAYGSGGVLLTSASGDTLVYDYDEAGYVRLAAVGDYTEAFGSALGNQWSAIDGTWTVTGGKLELSSAASAAQRRIILRRHRDGDFTAQVDVAMEQDGDDSAALMFNVLNNEYYYILRLGQSAPGNPYHNQLSVALTTTNAFPGSPLAAFPFTAIEDTTYTLKMAYTAATGRIQAKVWTGGVEPDWQLDVSDTTWRNGAFGFRADRTARFDNLYINGFRTYYQPIAID